MPDRCLVRPSPRTAIGTLVLAFLLGTAAPALASPIALGVTISDAPDNPSAIDAYSGLAGRSPAIVMWYQAWSEPLYYSGELDQVAARGAVPMVTWEPAVAGRGVPMADIAAGKWDSYIVEAARQAASWGRPLYIRFAHEMNIRSSPWAVGVEGNTPARFIAAWRHVVSVFRSEGATNVRWVWSPNLDCSGHCPFTALYPGDAWVDYVALDGYNYGPVDHTAWQSLAELFRPSYDALASVSGRPVMIAETASTERGGDKAAWITRSFMHDIPAELPRVRAVIWFDHDKETDWRVNSSAASLAAWRAVVGSSLYQGAAPIDPSASAAASAAGSRRPGARPSALVTMRCRVRGRLCTVSGRIVGTGACAGSVRVTVRRGRRRLAWRGLRVGGDCHFRGRIRVRRRVARLSVSASFRAA